METEELTIGRVHHGRNIRRTRIEKDMNQEGLSELVHLSQPAVSKYEKMKVIDDEMLQRFARALNVLSIISRLWRRMHRRWCLKIIR